MYSSVGITFCDAVARFSGSVNHGNTMLNHSVVIKYRRLIPSQRSRRSVRQ